jgi:hypothetical protein
VVAGHGGYRCIPRVQLEDEMPEDKFELVSWESFCDSCGYHGEPVQDFEVRRVDADTKGDWTAEGVGRRCHCLRCGALCSSIIRTLPIELDKLPCPRCKGLGNYDFSLSCVITEGNLFEFSSTLTCRDCSSRSMFRKLAASFRRIRGIRIGPIGLELSEDQPR